MRESKGRDCAAYVCRKIAGTQPCVLSSLAREHIGSDGFKKERGLKKQMGSEANTHKDRHTIRYVHLTSLFSWRCGCVAGLSAFPKKCTPKKNVAALAIPFFLLLPRPPVSLVSSTTPTHILFPLSPTRPTHISHTHSLLKHAEPGGGWGVGSNAGRTGCLPGVQGDTRSQSGAAAGGGQRQW